MELLPAILISSRSSSRRNPWVLTRIYPFPALLQCLAVLLDILRSRLVCSLVPSLRPPLDTHQLHLPSPLGLLLATATPPSQRTFLHRRPFFHSSRARQVLWLIMRGMHISHRSPKSRLHRPQLRFHLLAHCNHRSHWSSLPLRPRSNCLSLVSFPVLLRQMRDPRDLPRVRRIISKCLLPGILMRPLLRVMNSRDASYPNLHTHQDLLVKGRNLVHRLAMRSLLPPEGLRHSLPAGNCQPPVCQSPQWNLCHGPPLCMISALRQRRSILIPHPKPPRSTVALISNLSLYHLRTGNNLTLLSAGKERQLSISVLGVLLFLASPGIFLGTPLVIRLR